MDFDELLDSLLESDDQADRSVSLVKLRDGLSAVQKERDELTAQTEKLTEQSAKLRDRNGELYLLLDDRGITKKEESIKERKETMSLEDKMMNGMFN